MTKLRSRAIGIATVLLATASGCTVASSDDAASASDLSLGDLPVTLTPAKVQAGVFTQEIDHPIDGGPSVGTFQQRFWYSTEFAKGPDAPVLLAICGESACDENQLLTITDSAKVLGAAVVALEHRYYGESLPFADLSLGNMKYLTIHNALEDLAAFEQWIKAQPASGLGGKWIAVGGSYSGMLAAFYREKHPDLVVGAWASSAPVDVQLSFWGYDAIVSRALGDECTALFQRALKDFDAAHDDRQVRAKIDPTNMFAAYYEVDKVTLMNTLSGVPMSLAQYDSQNGAGVRQLCSALEQFPDSPAEGLMAYFAPPLTPDDEAPGDPAKAPDGNGAPPRFEPKGTPSPAKRIPQIVIPAAAGDFAGSEWFYQVCTEVGFYQVASSDRKASVMSELINQTYFDRACESFVKTRPNIEKTRAEYVAPLLEGKVSNVLFVNGSLDPWSALGFPNNHPNAPGITTMTVQRGTHCEDLQLLVPTSLVGIFQAHKAFAGLAKNWLAE